MCNCKVIYSQNNCDVGAERWKRMGVADGSEATLFRLHHTWTLDPNPWRVNRKILATSLKGQRGELVREWLYIDNSNNDNSDEDIQMQRVLGVCCCVSWCVRWYGY